MVRDGGKEYAPHPAAFSRLILVTRFKPFSMSASACWQQLSQGPLVREGDLDEAAGVSGIRNDRVIPYRFIKLGYYAPNPR